MIKFYDTPEDFKNNNLMCNAWVATAIVGSAVIGAGASIFGSQNAASAQRDAAQAGIDAQNANNTTIRKDFAPYRAAGESALTELQTRLPHLTSDIDVTQELQNPDSTAAKAYNFTSTQGLKAVQNSAAARGLGNSGAALKGAAAFSTGLADNTYKSLFDMENINRTNAYSRLKGIVDEGQASSAQTATAGTNTANQTASLLTGAGNATAAASNATGAAVGNLASNIGGYAAYKGLYGGGGSNGA